MVSDYIGIYERSWPDSDSSTEVEVKASSWRI